MEEKEVFIKPEVEVVILEDDENRTSCQCENELVEIEA